TPTVELGKGAEMGRFKLGSTVILLFGPETVSLGDSVKPDDPIKLGEAIASML
ncbi:MAG: phosphatidylserine decarboxylase, partial [Gammaproteobacteria bacterium]|nr:phosphatidylserine decarboxylase [Gammaproteobacteria bacterium]